MARGGSCTRGRPEGSALPRLASCPAPGSRHHRVTWPGPGRARRSCAQLHTSRGCEVHSCRGLSCGTSRVTRRHERRGWRLQLSRGRGRVLVTVWAWHRCSASTRPHREAAHSCRGCFSHRVSAVWPPWAQRQYASELWTGKYRAAKTRCKVLVKIEMVFENTIDKNKKF